MEFPKEDEDRISLAEDHAIMLPVASSLHQYFSLQIV
jgi:hypothetical protein